MTVYGFPGYLRDPDYFRLGYQLVAIPANAAASARALPREGPQVRHPETKNLEQARNDAEALLDKTVHALEQLAISWKLDVPRQRLQIFLAGTIEPSVRLVLAGLQVELNPQASTDLLALIPSARVVLEPRGWRRGRQRTVPWSYRSLFTLACLAAVHSSVHGPESVTSDKLARLTAVDDHAGRPTKTYPAIWALERSFALVQGRTLARLVAWTEQDPAIALLRDDKAIGTELDQLLDAYRIPAAEVVEQVPPADDLDRRAFDVLRPPEIETFLQTSRYEEWSDALAEQVLARAVELRLQGSPSRRFVQREDWMLLAKIVRRRDEPDHHD